MSFRSLDELQPKITSGALEFDSAVRLLSMPRCWGQCRCGPIIQMLVYRENLASPSLSRHIECFWNLQGITNCSPTSYERLLPDGRFEVVINLAEPFKQSRFNQQYELQSRMVVIGQMSSVTLIEPTGSVDLFGIKFRTAGACAFFNLPLTELTDTILPLDELWRTRVNELEGRLYEATLFSDRVRIIEAILSSYLTWSGKLDATVEEGVRRILRGHGRLPIRSLRKGLGICERQFERKFRATIGIGPKQLSRIIRFQNVIASYDLQHPEPWSALAYGCGYFDQSHLIRDFNEFSGQNPSSYFSHLPVMFNTSVLSPGTLPSDTPCRIFPIRTIKDRSNILTLPNQIKSSRK